MAVAGKSGYYQIELKPYSYGTFGIGYARFYWQEYYDAEKNASYIAITNIQVTHDRSYGQASVSFTAYANDVAFASGVGSVNLPSSWTFTNVTGVSYPLNGGWIYHNDSTGEGSVSLKFYVKIAGFAIGFVMDNTGSTTVALTTIPRSSTISATDANVEAVSSITVVKKTSSYTHSIKYQFGELSGYINADGSVSSTEVKLSETSIGFTVPADFYTQIKNEKTGVCTLSVTTYSGSAKIGDAKTCTFTVTAAEANCAPIVSGTVVDGNIITQELTGDPNILVRFFSEAVLTLTAVPQHGSTIMEKYIAGKEVTSDLLLIPAVETNSFFFRAVDSRGYAGTATVVKDMVPYIRLTNNASCDRTDATSGNALLKLKGNYFDGSFGAADNEITAKYKINDGEYVVITDSLTIADNAYTAEFPLSGLDYQSVHTIEVVLSDKLNEAVKKTITVGKGEPVVAWGEDFFKVYGNLKVNGGAMIGGKALWEYVYPVGSIYISCRPESPASLFGGTWERLANQFLWGTDVDANIGQKGGESAHTLTVNEMPSHNHGSRYLAGTLANVLFDDGLAIGASGIASISLARARSWSGAAGSASYRVDINATHEHDYNGGGAAHNNMPPYLEVAMWRRTA